MTDQTPAQPAPNAIEKYKTVALAVAADDVPASRELLAAFRAMGKDLSEEDVLALGFRWFTLRKKEKSPDMINFLHELGFSMTQFVPNAGRRAASGNHLPFLLLEDPNEVPLLKRAIEIGAIPLTQRDTRGDSLLADALDMNNFELADWLLEKGIDPNLKNVAGQTALHGFAAKANFRAVHWLVTHGADPDVEDIHYNRPSQLVPESIEDGWDVDCLYDALEDFVDDFKAGRPFQGNPTFFEQVAREEREEAEDKAKAEASRKPKSP